MQTCFEDSKVLICYFLLLIFPGGKKQRSLFDYTSAIP